MKRIISRLAIWAVLALGAAPVFACGFDEVAAGTCPQIADELPQAPAPNAGEVGVLDVRYVWTKWSEFKSKDEIILKVCLFRGPAQTVSKTAVTGRDFRKASWAFESVGKSIETAANAWTEFRQVVDGQMLESRVKFSVRGTDGKIRACEDMNKDWHVAVVIGTKGDFFVGHGSQTLEDSRNRGLGTMFINSSFLLLSNTNAKHEFGHALGLTHEMVHRDWEPCAKAFLPAKWAARTGETEDKARANVNALIAAFQGVKPDMTEKMDEASIMTYQFSKGDFDQSLLKGKVACTFTRNNSLSDDDRYLYLKNYGRAVAN